MSRLTVSNEKNKNVKTIDNDRWIQHYGKILQYNSDINMTNRSRPGYYDY